MDSNYEIKNTKFIAYLKRFLELLVYFYNINMSVF